jgi:hypothetical protein
MTITTIVGLALVAIGLIISHWPKALWELRHEDDEVDEMATVDDFQDPVYSRIWEPDQHTAWFFKGYDGHEWGPFATEAAARVNHRNYLLVVDRDHQ